MNIWIEHWKAWWRGDLSKITKVFEKAVKDLEAHGAYMTAIADNQAQQARDLQRRSQWLYEQSAASNKIATNLKGLLK